MVRTSAPLSDPTARFDLEGCRTVTVSRPRGSAAEPRVWRSFRERVDTATITDEAIAAMWSDHPSERLLTSDLVVVIAALDEQASIGAVIDEVPGVIGDLATCILVVDDGSTDDTAAVASRHGAVVCRLQSNCGHGAALRAGYQIARKAGARYIATLDADGQWNPSDLPGMLRLLTSGDADFVLGSRQLGRTEDGDAVRNLGVRFFSWVISGVTRTPITDSSSGLRALRSEVTGRVRQTQPQYQTSELLIGAIFQGYRVAEVPTVMRRRMAGESKKGHNLLYGARYAAVIARTTVREWRTRVPYWRQARSGGSGPAKIPG
jgi:glycosyltransferase involved in cell wall biosynthesis